jgi:uncharacterized protein YjiS (DUF1127 family)
MGRHFRTFWGRFTQWRRNQRAIAELYALDDQSLADIGVRRSDIPYVIAGDPQREFMRLRPRSD